MSAAPQMVLVSTDDLVRFVREGVRAELETLKAANEREYLTVSQVAALLQMSTRNVANLVAAGMPSLRAGGERRFRRADVVAWMEQRGRAKRTRKTSGAAK